MIVDLEDNEPADELELSELEVGDLFVIVDNFDFDKEVYMLVQSCAGALDGETRDLAALCLSSGMFYSLEAEEEGFTEASVVKIVNDYDFNVRLPR